MAWPVARMLSPARRTLAPAAFYQLVLHVHRQAAEDLGDDFFFSSAPAYSPWGRSGNQSAAAQSSRVLVRPPRLRHGNCSPAPGVMEPIRSRSTPSDMAQLERWQVDKVGAPPRTRTGLVLHNGPGGAVHTTS